MRIDCERLKVFVLGMLAALAIMFLLGATGMNNEVGRYSVAGAGNQKIFGFVLLDTATGEYIVINPMDANRGRFF